MSLSCFLVHLQRLVVLFVVGIVVTVSLVVWRLKNQPVATKAIHFAGSPSGGRFCATSVSHCARTVTRSMEVFVLVGDDHAASEARVKTKLAEGCLRGTADRCLLPDRTSVPSFHSESTVALFVCVHLWEELYA